MDFLIDASGLQTSEPGQYDLNKLEAWLEGGMIALKEEEKAFIAQLCRNRQVLFDWGWDDFQVTKERFVVDRQNKQILVDGVDISSDESRWQKMDPERFHEIAEAAFSGNLGFTSADTIAVLESSGITVELINTEKHGPSDPDAFMTELRASIRNTALITGDLT